MSVNNIYSKLAKKSGFCTVALLICGMAHCQPCTYQIGDFRITSATLTEAIAELTSATQSMSQSQPQTTVPIYLFECWNDSIIVSEHETSPTAFVGSINASNSFISENTTVSRFSISVDNATIQGALNAIASVTSQTSWACETSSTVCNIVRTELMTDSRWPLNRSLGSFGNQALTFDQAKSILFNNFDLMHDPDGDDEPYLDVTTGTVVIWNPSSTATVRDLVDAMIRFASKPGAFYKAQVGVYFDPAEGFSSLASMPSISWQLFRSNEH